MSEHIPPLPRSYWLDESDPDLVVLRRSDDSFVAAFSARGVTREGISETAREDYRNLLAERLAKRELLSLEELPEEVAIVDRVGIIIAVNESWRSFALANGGDAQRVCEGANYLVVCDSAMGDQEEYAKAFAQGLRGILHGQDERFAMEYPCHSPSEWRWFVGRVWPLQSDDERRALVTHENITARKSLMG